MLLFHLRHSTLRRIHPHVEKGTFPGAWGNGSSDGLVRASVHHHVALLCDSKLGKINERQIHSHASQSSGLLPSMRRNSWLSQTGCRQRKLRGCWSWFECVPNWQVKWGDSGWPVQGSQWEEHFSCNAMPSSPKDLDTSGHMWIPTVRHSVSSWHLAMARYTDQQWSTISAWASMRMQTLWRTASSLQIRCLVGMEGAYTLQVPMPPKPNGFRAQATFIAIRGTMCNHHLPGLNLGAHSPCKVAGMCLYHPALQCHWEACHFALGQPRVFQKERWPIWFLIFWVHFLDS